MPKINEDNYLGLIIDNLTLLKDALTKGEISSQLFDGTEKDKITELEDLLDYLQKTN